MYGLLLKIVFAPSMGQRSLATTCVCDRVAIRPRMIYNPYLLHSTAQNTFNGEFNAGDPQLVTTLDSQRPRALLSTSHLG